MNKLTAEILTDHTRECHLQPAQFAAIIYLKQHLDRLNMMNPHSLERYATKVALQHMKDRYKLSMCILANYQQIVGVKLDGLS